jgi:MGT family glycosyltransferase
MARIALVNAPFHSHVAAMMRLAGVLARQGHELIVWAPEDWRVAVERLGAAFELSSPSLPRFPEPIVRAELAAITEREAERLIPELHRWNADLVIRDSQTPWALVAAEYLGIPRIVSHPMFPMPSAAVPDPIDSDPIDSDPVDSDPAERERFEERWLSIARRWGVELDDVRGLDHRTSEPTLLYTTEEIAGDRDLANGWRCVGPLLSAPPRPRPDGRRPLVYACFGTAQNRRTELFRIAIAALADRPVQLLISTGGRRFMPRDLGPLPANVVVRESVAVRDVLARASVHITHGGCNSVHESLVAGVPMVCLPQAFDQIPLSRRVAELGVGVTAEEDPAAVAAAVLALLDDNSGVRARVQAMSGRLRHYDGEARVAAAVSAARVV